MSIKYCKLRKVKSPERGTKLSAGIDLFIPEFNDSFVDTFNKLNKDTGVANRGSFIAYNNKAYIYNHICLAPKERICIPSGLTIELPNDLFLMAANKSGISTKDGICRLAEIIDSDYQGELNIVLINLSKNIKFFKPNDKVVQFILLPNIIKDFEEVDKTEIHLTKSERSINGFGSTNTKGVK